MQRPTPRSRFHACCKPPDVYYCLTGAILNAILQHIGKQVVPIGPQPSCLRLYVRIEDSMPCNSTSCTTPTRIIMQCCNHPLPQTQLPLMGIPRPSHYPTNGKRTESVITNTDSGAWVGPSRVHYVRHKQNRMARSLLQKKMSVRRPSVARMRSGFIYLGAKSVRGERVRRIVACSVCHHPQRRFWVAPFVQIRLPWAGPRRPRGIDIFVAVHDLVSCTTQRMS